MDTPEIELEGTTEEILERLTGFAGERLHVTVRRIDAVGGAASEEAPYKLTITDRLLERFREVPPEEQGKVPPDLTDNLDHYIYGLPTR